MYQVQLVEKNMLVVGGCADFQGHFGRAHMSVQCVCKHTRRHTHTHKHNHVGCLHYMCSYI